MAQWRGGYQGNTHLSLVRDREAQLQDAVVVYRSVQTDLERHRAHRTVERLAERLHRARVKAVKAYIAALDPRDVTTEEAARRRLDRLFEGGVPAILDEYCMSEP